MVRGPDYLPRRFWREHELRRLAELVAAGWTAREVAEALGRSRYGVLWHARRLGLTWRHQFPGGGFFSKRAA